MTGGEFSLVQLIGNLGFPVVMCIWFMYSQSRQIRDLKEMMGKLLDRLETITDLLEKNGRKK